MNKIVLKTAKRKTAVSRTVVRNVVTGVFVQRPAAHAPKKVSSLVKTASAKKTA